MKYLYLLFFTIAYTQNLYSQFIKIENNSDQKSNIEQIILQNKNFGKDTIALKKYLSPLIQSNNKTLQPVYFVLLAKGYSNAFDNINPKSNENYKKAIKLIKNQSNQDGLAIWILTDYAFYLYHYAKISEALKVFMDADNLITHTSSQKIILPGDCFMKIGFFMGTIGDEKTAIDYLKKAESFSKHNEKELAALQDNIGYYYLKLNDLVNAKKYFSEAKKTASNSSDKVRYAKILGNLALLAQTEKNYALAEKLIAEDILISKTHDSDRNTMFALIQQSKIRLDQNKINEAKLSLEEATNYAKSKDYFKNSELEITKLRLEVAIKEKDDASELALRRKIDDLEKNYDLEESKPSLEKSNILVQKERYTNQLSLANSQFEQEQIKNKAISIIIILLIILIIVIFISKSRQQKNRKVSYEKTVLQLELEKIKSEKKLDSAQNTLESYRTYITEKNNQIESLNKEIIRVRKSSSSSIEQEEQQLQKLLESHLMTEENWRKFQKTFQKEFPDFTPNLKTEFPDLTLTNLRFLALIKLGLTNVEIASILGITIDAVKKSKQRLRKKMGDKFEDISL